MGNTLVIRRKAESQNGGNKKTKHAKFSEKRTFLTPRVRIRGIKMFVFRKIWGALFPCYLRFEIRPFVLSPTDMGAKRKY